MLNCLLRTAREELSSNRSFKHKMKKKSKKFYKLSYGRYHFKLRK